MERVSFTSGQYIARANDKVKYWYLIQDGSIVQKFDNSTILIGKNSIIGMSERDIYMCDYVVLDNVTAIAFECNNADDVKKVLTGQERIRNIFLRAAIEQRHRVLQLYNELYDKARSFHSFVESVYNEYGNLCNKFNIEAKILGAMDRFNIIDIQHKAEQWEVDNSNSLINNYVFDYIKLMEKDDALTVGVIMETAAQTRRFSLGIIELDSYLSYNKNILISEASADILGLYFDLLIQVKDKQYDEKDVEEMITTIEGFASELGIYNERTLVRRINEIKQSDAKNISAVSLYADYDISSQDCLGKILEYASYKDSEIDEISEMIRSFRQLPDMYSMDNEVYATRKKITKLFYDIYYKVFIKAVEDEENLTPIIKMFLNFGFMDVSYVGEEFTKILCDLSQHLNVFHSAHIYTIYEWLKNIYHGNKEPSKNEFDLTYAASLNDLKRAGKITDEQYEKCIDNPLMKVEFEIKNMFATVNKVTYGRISTFCPILCENDLINSIDKMLMLADRLEEAMNEIRKVDYSVFYREVQFTDPSHGINCENVMKEVLPDIILMPNAGVRSMMWQETSGVKSDTPARFMFPIFTVQDPEELMLETIGRYRWEMCRKIEGMRWNDFREKSLTAEYCAYIQFYKKNNDLSAEAKEKIKTTLLNTKNNYREVFVRDYISWIRFESKGSFRLNKVSRDILVRYCPFVKAIREKLMVNPLYQQSLTRFETENSKKWQRYQGINIKYEKQAGVIPKPLKDNIMFYEM